jgi:hypothetical protein
MSTKHRVLALAMKGLDGSHLQRGHLNTQWGGKG